MRRIVVICYALSPNRGSEFSVAWNYVQNISVDNELYVIYGTSGGGIGIIDEVEQWDQSHGHSNIHFIDVQIENSVWMRFLNRCRNYTYRLPFYFQYKIWHKTVRRRVQELCEKEQIDVIHYLNPIGFAEPGMVYDLDKPYIWGPISGVHVRPFALYKAQTFAGILDSLFRLIAHNAVLFFSPQVKAAINNTNILFTATSKSQMQFVEIYNKKSVYLPENGILKMEMNKPISVLGNTIKLIWVGRIDSNKALILLLEAVARIDVKQRSKIELNVIGSGNLQKKMMRFTKKHGIDDIVNFKGQMLRAEVHKIFNESHLHIISSLGEANTTVLWEAMSKGIPTMTLDHCGMSGVVCDKCGIKIPINSYEQVVNDLKVHIENIIDNPQIINTLSKGVLRCSEKFMWNNRIKIFNEAYEEAIRIYNERNE